MISSLSAIVGGVETRLDDQALCWLEQIDELGMSPLHRLTQRGPLQNGDTDVGYRLDPRFLALVLGFQSQAQAAQRKQLLDIFKPRTSNTPVVLKFILDDDSVRQIDGHYYSAMSMGSPQRQLFYQQVGVVLRCPDPLYYDPTRHSNHYGLAAGAGGFTVPMPVPIDVGRSFLSADSPVTYGGDAPEFPVVVLEGPLSGPILTNVTTGEKLDFTGATVAVGDAYTVDCRYGFKTVTDGAGNNVIAALADGSDLATFHLECDPDAPGGVNEITLTSDGVTADSQVTIFFYDRFIGI